MRNFLRTRKMENFSTDESDFLNSATIVTRNFNGRLEFIKDRVRIF